MIVISGLQGDGYLIDNPIWVELSDSVTTVSYVEITIQNLYNAKTVSPFRVYPFGNKCKFNLQPIAKGLFDPPEHNVNYTSSSEIIIPKNANEFLFEFTFHYANGTTETVNYQKNFIRGGMYATNDLLTNRMIASGTLLHNAVKVPRFIGYPLDRYYLSADKKVVKRNLSYVGFSDLDDMEIIRNKTCDGAYIKFLNSKGGYSYWLFEDWKNTSENDYLGYTTGMRNITDLGSEAEFEFEAFTKVPSRYLGLMTDLIYSKEIYLYLNNGSQGAGAWKRIVIKSGNKIEQKRKAVAYGITIKFEQVKNYNPALIW